MRAATLLAEAEATLAAAGVEAASWDAERLLRHVLGWDRAELLARPEAEVAPAAADRLRGLVRERARRVPLQYLLGVQAFWKHEFVVSPDVLIPRPETELVVEASLAWLAGRARPVLVDVGTGSGCIALSLAAERPDAEVHATDVSRPALAIARENARRLGLEERVGFHLGDLLGPLRDLWGRLSLVASNPPYVAAADSESLAPEVRNHEPAIALFGRGDPLRLYARLAEEAAQALPADGLLVLEIGQGQRASVEGCCRDAGFAIVETRLDLQGIPRVLVARRAR